MSADPDAVRVRDDTAGAGGGVTGRRINVELIPRPDRAEEYVR